MRFWGFFRFKEHLLRQFIVQRVPQLLKFVLLSRLVTWLCSSLSSICNTSGEEYHFYTLPQTRRLRVCSLAPHRIQVFIYGFKGKCLYMHVIICMVHQTMSCPFMHSRSGHSGLFICDSETLLCWLCHYQQLRPWQRKLPEPGKVPPAPRTFGGRPVHSRCSLAYSVETPCSHVLILPAGWNG
ncbi:hypothetical protein BJV74DRAFT_496072 [Russula compacta]|nr:hypothetical protein BJV74DRAFT_496072 [Russula compacta]